MPESVDIMYEDCNCTISVCRECEGDIPSKIGPVCSKHPQSARKDNSAEAQNTIPSEIPEVRTHN